MKLDIILKQSLSNKAVAKIVSDINFLKTEDPDYKDYEVLHIGESIIKSILVFTDTSIQKFNIGVGDTYLRNYICEIGEWASMLPYTYDAIKNRQSFDWEFSDWQICYLHFTYKNEAYSIQLSDTQLKKEIISVEDLKKEIDSARKIYYNYVKENLGDVLPDYLELLDLSFDEI